MYGYPTNYIPNQKTAPVITDKKKQAARERNATHLSMDGKRAYACRMGTWAKLEWDGQGFGGSWWQLPNEPVDKVEL